MSETESYNPDLEFDPKLLENREDPEMKTIFTRYIINTLVIIGLLAVFFSIIFYIVDLWPPDGNKLFVLGNLEKKISMEQRLFILVALGGALGAFVHAATSFTDFLGNNKLVYSWLPWYFMRPFIGSSLALIFYIVIRGGIVSFDAGGMASDNLTVNPFGIMTVACLAGLFSKQAIDKLREIFENIFQLKKEVERKDSLDGSLKTQHDSEVEIADETPQG